jgi:lycopene beta-cyclase
MVIAGGGLAGCLAALALVRQRPEISLLVVEQAEQFGGNHTWSFFDTDLSAAERALIQPLICRHWPSHDIRFPSLKRTLGIGYNSVRSERLDTVMRAELRPDQYRLGRAIKELAPGHVILDDGERIEAAVVIDARGPGPMPGLQLGWQKFVGRTYRSSAPHDCVRPVIMDALVDQENGYRFLYSLPFSETELMVEDTYYSTSPVLDVPLVRSRLDRLVARGGAAGMVGIGQETGLLPVLLGGQIEALWPTGEAPVPKLGLRGGFFHPTTGYSLPDACRNALLIAAQADLSGGAVYDLLASRARTAWTDRTFFQLLNRMLFHAAEPKKRYRVLEHFYRLPEPVIARFYGARLTRLDKLRILSGRPPVGITRAIAAIRGKAA